MYIIIDFDDGYSNAYDLVFPVLKKHNIKYNINVIGSKSYIYQLSCVPRFLSKEQVDELRDYGCTVGYHSLNHVALTDVSNETVDIELKTDMKNDSIFCFPYGKFNNKLFIRAKNHYDIILGNTVQQPNIINNNLFNKPLNRYIMKNTTTLDDFKNHLTKYSSNEYSDRVCIINFHQIKTIDEINEINQTVTDLTYVYNFDLFKQIIEYLVDNYKKLHAYLSILKHFHFFLLSF